MDDTWPWEPRWFETPEGRMHHVDVGEGPPIVLVHGNPTWGYMFRHAIQPLVDAGHRVIVPDHLGFGRSEPARTLGVADHARRLAALLDSLDLDRITLVVHDWGGPLALPWAVRHADRIAALVLVNTFGHRPARVPLPLRLIRIPVLGELLVKTFHIVARAMLPRDPAYRTRHPTAASRAPILALARAYPVEVDATALRCPVLVVWGERDTVLDPAEPARWLTDFPPPASCACRMPGTSCSRTPTRRSCRRSWPSRAAARRCRRDAAGTASDRSSTRERRCRAR